MSNELISIIVLVAVFLVATTMGINMGVLGVVAAFGLGTALGVSEDDIFAGFPGDLFVILVGVTLLVRHRLEQRDGGLADPGGGEGGQRPHDRDSLGLLPRHRGPHRVGRGRPGRRRDRRADRARLRDPVRHQPGADGALRHQRRDGRRLLADQRVRLDRQRRGRARGPGRERDAAVRQLVHLQLPAVLRRVLPVRRAPAARPPGRAGRDRRRTTRATGASSARSRSASRRGTGPPSRSPAVRRPPRRRRCRSSTATRSSRSSASAR